MTQGLPYRYVLTLSAAPQEPVVDVQVELFDNWGNELANRQQTWFAFGTTWKDVAELVHDTWLAVEPGGLPKGTVSPHLDLT